MNYLRILLAGALVAWCLWLTHWAIEMHLLLDEYQYRVKEVERLSPLVLDSLTEVIAINTNTLERMRGGVKSEN